jgi:hypothetical protein
MINIETNSIENIQTGFNITGSDNLEGKNISFIGSYSDYLFEVLTGSPIPDLDGITATNANGSLIYMTCSGLDKLVSDKKQIDNFFVRK